MENSPPPALGRIVHYVLDNHDVELITSERNRARKASPMTPVRHGNPVRRGDVCSAQIVKVWAGGPGKTMVNLQVHLDGNDVEWITSRTEGGDPGQWHWPEIR